MKGLLWLSASEAHIRKASQGGNTAGQEPEGSNFSRDHRGTGLTDLLSLLSWKTQGHLCKGDSANSGLGAATSIIFQENVPTDMCTGQSDRLFSQPKALVPGVSRLGQAVKNTKQDTAILFFAMFKERMKTTYEEFLLAPDMKIQLIGVTKA